MRFRRSLGCAILAGLTLVPAYSRQQARGEKPLPSLESFLKEVRGRLRSDRSLLSRYTYTEKDTVRSLDGKGKLRSIQESVYEVYPSAEPGQTYRRLIAKDGKPTPPKELEKQDREYDKKLKERTRKLELESAGQREQRLAKEAEEKRKEERAVDDMIRLYEIKMEGREWIGDQPAIILSFQPRLRVKPLTDEGKILVKVAGRAWISELEYELVRIDARLIDNLSLGWGLLARMNKGATALLQRRKINNEIWLPVEVRFTGSARLLLLKAMNVDFTGQYSDFLKFTVETQVQFRKDNIADVQTAMFEYDNLTVVWQHR